MINATRNQLIHGYLGIDNDTLWSIIQDDVPGLLPILKSLKTDAGRPKISIPVKKLVAKLVSQAITIFTSLSSLDYR